jgi:hypothetical protein
VAFTDTSGDGVWYRLYLALLSWILIGLGCLAVLNVGLAGRLAERWLLVPVGLGILGLTAAAIGPLPARRALAGISGLLVLIGAYQLIEGWMVMGLDSSETVSAAALVVAGVAGVWLARAWSVTRIPRPAQRSGTAAARERWWQTRWWLLLVVTAFPFALGITAALVSVVTAPSASGCDAPAQRALADHAGALATRINGLHLGEPGGCDSGDSAYIGWEHASLDELVASASAAGCRDAYVEDWDDEYHFMVCDQGFSQLLLLINLDTEVSGVTGDLFLDR